MNACDLTGPATDTQVAIVGCGPVGATLALLLAKRGVSTVLLEREHSIYPLPRAVHFDDQIMRVFQAIGIADDLEKVTRYNPGMRFVDPKGNLLLDWPRPSGVGENGWYSSYRFHQPDLESLLRSHIERSAYSCLITGAKVTEVQQTANHGVVTFKNHDNDQTSKLTASFVVGCDGANSTVRQYIGDDVDDMGFNERWVVVDVLLNKEKPELGDFTIQHCGGDRPATYVRGPENRRRWEMSLTPSDNLDTIATDASIWNLLAPWLSPVDATIERSAIYEFKSTVATRWRNKRLFIAGDAAHLTPPFMGQGMCAGIRDVSNLAWKIALCLRHGHVHSDLTEQVLKSYQAERESNVKAYINTAISLGVLLNSCSTRESLEKAFPNTDGVVQMQSIVPGLGQGLVAGADRHQGTWFPQPVLADGQRLDDVANGRAVVLANTALWQEYLSLNDSAKPNIPVLLSDDEPSIAALLEELETKAVLLRPDYYLMGSAADTGELNDLLKTASTLFTVK